MGNETIKMDADIKNNLIESALAAMANAYCPYSKYSVGAALLAGSGKIYSGANVENASYAATICGERTAIVKAISEGEREIKAIVIASDNGASPCGVCRQVMCEFGEDFPVIMVDKKGQIIAEALFDELLKIPFNASFLKNDG